MLALALPLVGVGVIMGYCGQFFACAAVGAAVGAAPLALAAWSNSRKEYDKEKATKNAGKTGSGFLHESRRHALISIEGRLAWSGGDPPAHGQ